MCIRDSSITAATLARLRRARYSASFKSKTSFVCLVCSYQNMNDGGFYETNQPTLCRLSSRILSAIIAMSSLLVGFPRRLWTVSYTHLDVDKRQAKGRPQDNPLIVHVTGPEMLPGLVSEVPERAQLLMAAFCPGPLTIILSLIHI